MNVFVIPSWYPYPAEPTSGVFTREQVLALADLRPDWGVAVSLWGQGELTVPLRTPSRLAIFGRAALAPRRSRVRRIRANALELTSPRVTWSPRILDGRAGAILAASRANLATAEAELGPISIIHAHVAYPAGWVAAKLSRERGLPYVITEHMAPFPFPGLVSRSGALNPRLVEAYAGAAARLAVSRSLAAEMERNGIANVEVVPNLVDESFFSPAPREHVDPFVFISLGRLEPRKGFDDLIDAAARIEGAFELRIGGKGPLEATLRDRVRELRLGDRVSFLGELSRNGVLANLRAADCFVLASRHESFGVVLAEALACGLPLIATRCGGPSEIVTPETGILVDVGRPDQLAVAMGSMMRHEGQFDPEMLHGHFLERFSRTAVVAELDAVYTRALSPG